MLKHVGYFLCLIHICSHRAVRFQEKNISLTFHLERGEAMVGNTWLRPTAVRHRCAARKEASGSVAAFSAGGS
jgi:hypothetical protein